jgi:chorismate mutase
MSAGRGPLDEPGRRSVVARAREVLELAKARIRDEIECYPSPIPACDEHFNHLLAERGWVSRALARLRAAEGSASPAECLRVLEELLDSPPIRDEVEARLRSCLREASP